MTRRQWLAQTPIALAAGLSTGSRRSHAQPKPVGSAKRPDKEPFTYCLNTSTISGQKLDPVGMVEVVAKAGYQAIEPWIGDLDRYVKAGGSLKELGQRIRDKGLSVESAIGFSEWIVDDAARRKKGLEDVRRCMDIVVQLGGTRLAAPPAGATNLADLNLFKIAERYRAILELGDTLGVVPQLELWGFSRTLSRLGEVAFAAIEAGHPKACMLLDVYHLYKGGSEFGGLHLLNGAFLHVLHFNDYPAMPTRNKITDAQRVYPGDGIAPLTSILRDLRQIGFHGTLSLELFNREYWKQDPLIVARTGLEKMRTAVRSALD